MTAALSLADLEAHDPSARSSGRERRFRCPLCTSADRDLSANTNTGAWVCYKCGAKGTLREFWTHRGTERRGPLPKTTPKPKTAAKPTAPKYDLAEVAGRIEDGPSMARVYLSEVRHLPDALAEHGAYLSQWGRSWVAFRLIGPTGKLAGLSLRALDSREPKSVTLKAHPDAHAGVFMTHRNAWESPAVVVVEAPIDALSLAAAGSFPVIATQGTNCPAWVAERLARAETVYLAHDGDEAGNKAAERVAALIREANPKARVKRFRPPIKYGKDWNAILGETGTDGLAALIREIRRFRPLAADSGRDIPSGGLEAAPSAPSAETPNEPSTEGPMIYTADMGRIVFPSPRTVIIAGRPREWIRCVSPEMIEHYAHADRVEASKSRGTPPEG